MPIDGFGCGQGDLGGGGRWGHWDIFNENKQTGSNGPRYARPLQPSSPLDQGFALRLGQHGKTQVRPFDHAGWREIQFRGEYPVGSVEYRDSEAPVSVSLEAFSPFIPLNTEDSALPATVMRFTIKNTSTESVAAEIAGWLENAVCLNTSQLGAGLRRNRIVRQERFTFLECSAEDLPQKPREAKRPDLPFDDFEIRPMQAGLARGPRLAPVPRRRAGCRSTRARSERT